jgi:hypothetical protein
MVDLTLFLLSNRLDTGDRLYLLRDQEVLGDLVMP